MKNLNYVSGTYLAFELSEKSRAQLLASFPPTFSKVICHHVTIEFNLTEAKLEYFKNLFKNKGLGVIGYAAGNGIECLAISIGGITKRLDDSFYHVTLSLEPPHKPVESNTLKHEVKSVCGFDIEGEFKLLRK